MQSSLTDEVFWDDFWSGIRLPDLIDPRIQWQLALTTALRANLPRDASLRLFEVGCAPGRWLIWFHQTFGYQVAGCDTSPKGLQLTHDNFAMNSVEAELYEADLMSDDLPRHAFDLVFSLGVIEHFRDPGPVVARHVDLLKPGGTLILEVPNFAGRINLWLLRAAGMHAFLDAHNLNIMRRSYFESVAQDHGLSIKYLGYLGGFDPGAVVYNFPRKAKQRWGLPAVFYPLWALERVARRMPKALTWFNAPSYSHMLLGVFSLPAHASPDLGH